MKSFGGYNFFLAGLALYWGEGSKTGRAVRVSNADPHVIIFMLNWFRYAWGVKDSRFSLHILINEVHKSRIKEVKSYWSRLTRIPKKQFQKTTFIKAKNKKVYKNFKDHYGTLAINVRKNFPSEIHHQIMGLIEKMGEEGANFKPA